MATSGSSNFSVTRDNLITYALKNVGAFSESETPTTQSVTDAAMLLNLIVKAWHSDGMPAWAQKLFNFALTATASYTIGTGATINTPAPVKVLGAYRRNTTSLIDNDLEVITREEYDRITNKSTTGTPLKVFYEPQGAQSSTGTIYVWPLPDSDAIANYSIYLRFERPYEDFDSSSDEPDFPQAFYLPILWQLTWAIAPSYGIPLDERKLWLAEATSLKQMALDSMMEEGSVYFTPQQE
jgi:hypothetical protein